VGRTLPSRCMTPPTFRGVGIISLLFYTRDKGTWSIFVYRRFLQSHVPNNVPNNVPNLFSKCSLLLSHMLCHMFLYVVPHSFKCAFYMCSLDLAHMLCQMFLTLFTYFSCIPPILLPIDSPTFYPIFLPQIPTLCSLHKVHQTGRI